LNRAVPIDLTCLGTADAFGSAGRHCAGYLVETEASHLLVDSGPSVLVALKAQERTTESIDAVVLSHLHGDHFGGVPFLLLEYTYENPRQRPLTIVGPPGTERRVFELYRALYAESASHGVPFDLRFVEIDEGRAYEIGDVRIEAFRVPHQENAISLGHRLRTADRTLVYSGDTAWTPDLLRHSSGADLFLCECSTFATSVPKHVRYLDIEANRKDFECDRLLLTHLGREIRAHCSEIQEELATDGMRVRL
jgi:ribonuclease BN (tRNA processing enzyme)